MTAPLVPARNPQLPGEQMILLFVNRTPATSIATYGSPFGSPALSLSTRRSTTMPFAPAVNSSMTPAPGAAKIPAPGAAHVSVTFGVVTATSAVTPKQAASPMTSLGYAAARAVARPAASVATTVAG